MLDFYLELFELFELPWNTSVKVLQKDSKFMFEKFDTNVRLLNGKEGFFYINCLDYIKVDSNYYDTSVTNKKTFFKKFEKLCKKVVDKDFILFRGGYPTSEDNLLEEFFNQSHGSGVSSLFYLYYNLSIVPYIKHIVIDNIDGILHPISMEQLCFYFKELLDYKVIFLMNQDVLFSNWIMDIDNLYMIHNFKVHPIRQCTDRELREAHNLQRMLRCGEFDIDN